MGVSVVRVMFLTEFSLRQGCSDSSRSHALPCHADLIYRHTEELVLVVAAKASWWSNTSSVSSAQAFANSGSFFLIVALRLDSRCRRSSLVMVMFYHSGRKALQKRPRI